MFDKLLRDWTAMPNVLNAGIPQGLVKLSPEPGWVPLKGLSAISDAFPPKAYGCPGFAEFYNKEIRKFRRRAAFSAFWSGMSLSELEASLESSAQLYAALGAAAPPAPREKQEGDQQELTV